MQNLLSLLLIALITAMAVSIGSADARSLHVSGYHRRGGHYVFSHHRTHANRTRRDNYSSKGNWNPYTGRVGTHRL